MNPFTLLHRDHKRVHAFFEDLMQARTAEKRQSLFGDLKKQLQQHLRLEEKYFYPILRNHQQTTLREERIRKGHDETLSFLRQLDGMERTDRHWKSLVTRLQKSFEDHVHQEEQGIFPHMRRYLDQREQRALGSRMLQTKQNEYKSWWQKLKDFFSL